MKKYLAAIAAVSVLAGAIAIGSHTMTRAAIPSPSTTFPTLTTIYVGSGVLDDGGADTAGIATSIHCSNVSGQNAQVRVLILSNLGAVEGSLTLPLVHGATQTFSTHQTYFVEGATTLNTGIVTQGVLNVESTESAVFCSAMIVPAATPQNGVSLHLVRVNPHPGTVE